MEAHKELIQQFYTAFSQLNHESMAECYHDEIQFSDPAFQNLQGKEVVGMWHMLCTRAQNFELKFENVWAEGNKGGCKWIATYLFSKTGRTIENHIQATFEFKDGKIIKHQDQFDFYKWTRMALGLSGILLGWTPFLQNKVRAMGMKELRKFMAKNDY
ncbi:MAG: nuclear transport factor 2 family protein [Flammeovirgaceae bacterium]